MGPAVRHKGQGIRHGALQKPRHYRGRALWSESEMSLMHSVPTCGSAGPAFLTYSHQADPLPKGHTSRSASSSSPLVGHSPPSCHPKPPLSGDSHAAHKEHREWVQKRGLFCGERSHAGLGNRCGNIWIWRCQQEKP